MTALTPLTAARGGVFSDRPWQDTAPARMLLAGLRREDFKWARQICIMGDFFAFEPTTQGAWKAVEKLEQMRHREVFRMRGQTFADADAIDVAEARAWLWAYDCTRPVADALAKRFGGARRQVPDAAEQAAFRMAVNLGLPSPVLAGVG